ncbi:hypothetical protein [Halocatena marina]|uniref:Uncharacterized protein n=1 Tax=Halocatena marina TaxID=2934937 RepID=A0ABD5YPJ7_9EURY|nr:hypothetical protein [Halocatena marina]
MNAKRVLIVIGAVLAFLAAITLYRQRNSSRMRRESGPTRARLDDGREVGIVKF